EDLHGDAEFERAQAVVGECHHQAVLRRPRSAGSLWHDLYGYWRSRHMSPVPIPPSNAVSVAVSQLVCDPRESHKMLTHVTRTPPAPTSDAAQHFARKLALETDCWDVHETMSGGAVDFILLDVRGPAAYAKAHVPGAVSLPHRHITAERMMAWPH